MDASKNLREFTRVNVSMLTKLVSGEMVEVVGNLSNVSLSGLFVECDGRLPVGTLCQVSLVLEGGLDTIEIQAAGNVTRTESLGMAVQFTQIFGPDSLTHLQNLVRYNSGDQVAMVSQELDSSVGLKKPY